MFLYNVFSKYPIIHIDVTKTPKNQRFSVTEQSKKKKSAETVPRRKNGLYGCAVEGNGDAGGFGEAGDGDGSCSI